MGLKTDRRPNILLIMADQCNPRFIGACGGGFARTPHLDTLAESGVTLTNFYCNSPLCAPSRASMVTGRLVSNLGAYDNGAELPASVPTFLHHLRRSGYETVLSGKMHFIGPDQLHGFVRRLTTDIYPANFAWTPDWRSGLERKESPKGIGKPGVVPWSDQLSYDTEVHAQALRAIREFGRGEAREPFLLCVSYTHPHDPFVITQEYWGRYENVTIPPPATAGTDPGALHPFNQWIQRRHNLHRFPPSERNSRLARRAYSAMVSYIDDLVGELLAEIAKWGLRERTLIIFTSDHGEMLGEHGMWFKRTFMEDAVKVPFILSWPGVLPAGRRIGATASLVDLFPTLLEIAAVPEAEEIVRSVDGASLAGPLAGTAPAKDEAVVEYCAEGVFHPAVAVRSGKHKYVLVKDHPSLLFDLENDPSEQKDLAGREDRREVREIMHRKVDPRWVDGSLEQAIRISQRQRHWIREAMRSSQLSWDFQPYVDASKQYRRDF